MKSSKQRSSRNLKSKLVPEIFIVKKVNFEQGNTDPFRFDDLTEKVGGIYVPFSGSIKRVRYLVFLPFVHLLLKALNIDGRNALIAKTRLEKLLVYLAIHKYNLPAGSGIMGISLKSVDPFYPHTGKWIVIDSYNLYGNSVKTLGLDQEVFKNRLKKVYLSDRLKKFTEEFLNKQGSLDEHGAWLKSKRQMSILDKSLFNLDRKINADILSYISKQIFDNEGMKKITSSYRSLRETPGEVEEVIEELKKDKRFPFLFLDRFYLACFNALDNETGGESTGSWETAFAALKLLKSSSHSHVLHRSAGVREWKNAVSPADLKMQLYNASKKNAPSWFDFNGEKISKGRPGYPDGYLEAVIAKAKASGANFRLPALKSILDDINKGGV